MVSTETDVVAMPSLRADGTPDQTPGFKVVAEDGDEKPGKDFDEFRTVTQETVPAPDQPAPETPAGKGTDTKAPVKK